ncbi:helix-turn-helix domain-containing protein [Microbacterium azadirachtae]|uniref:Helix-turn-helix domain protein n=1 Tax=Microbacterium azadirachtae TaxID=582680 RepID=A0A0F0LQI1_9MICO|nr:helix-turn-helix domain-containing protein [Microbacterium azadirachtae]KJL35477.1 Helix-turn-helix domain protein [Microbacterium azadirachtae]
MSAVLTSKQAAVYCGMKVGTLYNLISLGKGPNRYKQGSSNAFFEADLDEWMKGRLVFVPASVPRNGS